MYLVHSHIGNSECSLADLQLVVILKYLQRIFVGQFRYMYNNRMYSRDINRETLKIKLL